MDESRQFVEGWEIVETLGEGAYGEVKLLLNHSTGDAVAMKIIDLELHPSALDSVRKEIATHRLLDDKHIIKFIGHREEDYIYFIFLEYAAGGELFDRIELPWDRPTFDCPEYYQWKEYKVNEGLWVKIDVLALSMLRQILMPVPSKRATITQIKQHRWFKKVLKEGEISAINPVDSIKKPDDAICISQMGCSQPAQGSHIEVPNSHTYLHFSFSQPVNCNDLLLSSQQQTTQMSQSHGPLHCLVKRMTRFLVYTSLQDSQQELQSVCDQLGYQCWCTCPQIMTISTQDKRKMQLIFKVTLLDMGSNVLLDFRLSRGDGLEFKQHFLNIKSKFGEWIVQGPVM